MTIVRIVLLALLTLIGGYLGYRLGVWYTGITPIVEIISQRQGLATLSQAGFSLIGVLMGAWASARLTTYIGSLVGNLRRMPANDKVALTLGAVIGLLLTFLLAPVLNSIQDSMLRTTLAVGLAFVMVFLAVQGAMSMREELRKLIPTMIAAAREEREIVRNAKILDTNVIIDGRIADICRTGFIEGTIYVPQFVLEELHTISDSGDSLKRARGRRGLDMLAALRAEVDLVIGQHDHAIRGYEKEPVDTKLVRLAREIEGTLVTNDYNLNKVAALQKIPVLNVNQLANALRPVVLPGEELRVHLIKEGREQGQGVAYLDDGTMVVVENGRGHIGEDVEVHVTSVVQNVVGRMIFSNLKGVVDPDQEILDRNFRSYRSERERRRGPRQQDR